MAIVGYARVSTGGQEATGHGLTAQIDALKAQGVQELYTEVVSGGVPAMKRPVLSEVLSEMVKGDQLVTAKLDRLGRDPADVLTLLKDLKARGISVRFLDLGVDTQGSAWTLLVGIMAAVSGWEREIISERTRAGLDAARRTGTRLGPPPKLNATQKHKIRTALAQTEPPSVSYLAKDCNVSRPTIYRFIARVKAEQAAADAKRRDDASLLL